MLCLDAIADSYMGCVLISPMGVGTTAICFLAPLPSTRRLSIPNFVKSRRATCCLQAFAAPERLAEMAGRVHAALAGPLPAAVARMRLYLANPATHAILFKPIKSNIAEAHGQARPSS